MNNSGGGIFRILPGAKESTHFSNYFETTHHLKAKQLSEMFGFEYTSANSQNELKAALTNFFSISEKPKILEIVTPSEVNDRILLDYFDFIA